jgi:hypothetical protein
MFRYCSCSLNGVHMHSITFRGYSLPSQRHSCARNSVQGMFNTLSKAFTCTQLRSDAVQFPYKAFSILVTPWWVGFSNSSMTFICTQWVFTLTLWHSCTLNGLQRLFTLTYWHSCILNGCSGAFHNHSDIGQESSSLWTWHRPRIHHSGNPNCSNNLKVSKRYL